MVDTEKMDNGSSLAVEINANVPPSMKNCALCGSSAPAVRCDKCGSQTFCLSCDDMYHRHPKRKFHLRKAVDSIWNTYRSPRLRRRTDLPGDPSKIPVAPPRSKKRHSSLELPVGYKEFLQQKKLIEQKLVATTQNISPLPEPNGEGTNIIQDVAMDEDISAAAITMMEAEPLQRRSSMENPNVIPDQTSPIHVFVPGVGPVPGDMQARHTLAYGQTLQGQGIHHSTSATDLPAVTSSQPMPPMYHFPPHMHAYMHPHMNPYTPPLAHFNCPQCVSASWSNLMSPNMAAYHQLHMQQQQPPWAPPQSPASRSRNSPAPETISRADQSPLSFHGSLFSSPVFPYPSDGTFTPTMQAKTELLGGSDKHSLKSATSPLSQSVSPPVSTSGMTSGQKAQLQQILASEEEMEEEEEEEEEEQGANAADDEEFIIPEKPTTEWECAHCTYVNPPGSHICDVCCKTSYRKKTEPETPRKKKVKKDTTKKVASEKLDGSQKQSFTHYGEQSSKETDTQSFGRPQKVI